MEIVAEDAASRDGEGTAVRRHAELAQRSESGRGSGMTPPRASAPPSLPVHGSRAPTPRGTTPAASPRLSLTPLPIRPQGTSVTPPPQAVVVSRWAVFLGATLGIVAVAASLAALLIALADRSRSALDAGADSVAGLGAESGPGLEEVAQRTVPDVQEAGPAVAVPAAAPVVVPPRPFPGHAPAEPATNRPATSAAPPAPLAALSAPTSTANPKAMSDLPPPARRAAVRLAGLPVGARATLDGRPVEPEFSLEVSDATHTLRVVLPGHRPFVRRFRPTGDLEIDVRLESLQGGGSSGRPAEAARSGEENRGPTFRPLANPFGGR